MALVAVVIDWPTRARISIMARSAERSFREAADTTAVGLMCSLPPCIHVRRDDDRDAPTATEAFKEKGTANDHDD